MISLTVENLKSSLEKIRDLEKINADLRDELNEKLAKLQDLEQDQSSEQEIIEVLEEKFKAKYESTIGELEEKLREDNQQREEVECAKRKIETELNDLKEQVGEKMMHVSTILFFRTAHWCKNRNLKVFFLTKFTI